MIKSLKKKIKNFFKKKENRNLIIAIIVILLIVVIIALIFKKDKYKLALNKIYDVYPEDVRELYANMVSVSCYGDLYLRDINLDAEKTELININKNNLLDYMFSNLDKNNQLVDEMKLSTFKNTADELFSDDLSLENYINGYSYGDYTYTVSDNIVKREKRECTSDMIYITHLFGYSYNVNELSIDVNIGYLENDNLYDLEGNLLGKYNGNVSELANLFVVNSHYRYNYVLDNKKYKLKSVELKSRN